MNRTEEQLDNARVSDRVRQFAISWYLDNEVKKTGAGDGRRYWREGGQCRCDSIQ